MIGPDVWKKMDVYTDQMYRMLDIDKKSVRMSSIEDVLYSSILP